MITVIDYGLGNIASVANALQKLEIPYEVSGNVDVLKKAKSLILPGVGAASQGMENLKMMGLDRVIIEAIRNGKPLLGICLGMQLLFDRSQEGNVPCLGILKGEVKEFKKEKKVPQIGWNQVNVKCQMSRRRQSGYGASATNVKCMFNGIPNNSYFYFINSYYCIPKDQEIIVGQTVYDEEFACMIAKDNIIATQFHPEKSGKVGMKLLENIFNNYFRFPNY